MLIYPPFVSVTLSCATILIGCLYREVHKARSRRNGSLVALKKIIMHNEKDGVRYDLPPRATAAAADPHPYSFLSRLCVR